MSFFPIGDFHIKSEKQAELFSEYVNHRPEHVVVLLGDIIDFASSIWNVSSEVSIEKKKENIPKDVSVWEKFIASVKKKTLYYLGTHEMFALKVISKLYPSLKPKIFSSFVYVPENLELISIDRKDTPIFIIGLHIPDNMHPNRSEEFFKRKEAVEKWIEKKVESLSLEYPDKTYVCTHDPCDYYYTNMGYSALTKLLQKCSPKIHYHAHIHSNIRKTTVGKTPSINRSFIALSNLKPELLEPTTTQLRSMYSREI